MYSKLTDTVMFAETTESGFGDTVVIFVNFTAMLLIACQKIT